MTKRKMQAAIAATLLIVASLVAQTVSAAGVQAVIRTAVDVRGEITTGSIGLFLNDAPLPVVAEQTVTLGLFDVLRAETSASATHESGISVLSDRRVQVDLILDPATTTASVQTIFSGMGETTPETPDGFETGQGGAGSGAIFCDSRAGGCEAVGIPTSSFSSGVESTTIGENSNSILVYNESMDTGRRGGAETFDPLVTNYNLTQPEADGQQTTLFLAAQGLAIFQATSSGSGTLELTVTDLAVVPVPAAVWLFVGALGGLGVFGYRQHR